MSEVIVVHRPVVIAVFGNDRAPTAGVSIEEGKQYSYPVRNGVVMLQVLRTVSCVYRKYSTADQGRLMHGRDCFRGSIRFLTSMAEAHLVFANSYHSLAEMHVRESCGD